MRRFEWAVIGNRDLPLPLAKEMESQSSREPDPPSPAVFQEMKIARGVGGISLATAAAATTWRFVPFAVVLFDFDTGRRITALARDVLRTLGLNTLRELTNWAQTAQKNDLARLTPLLFEHEAEAGEILKEGSEALARLTAAVCRRLGYQKPPVQLMGGVFINQPLYARMFGAALKREWPGGQVSVCRTPPSLGAAFLAVNTAVVIAEEPTDLAESSLREASTEQVNQRSENLDRMPIRELVLLFVREEKWVEEALAACIEPLSQAIEVTTEALKRGGRLFYVGAGTSGRLGVLDASEMPPTFGVPPDRVQAIIAGGMSAMQASVEGAEDDEVAAALAIKERGVTGRDVVCGISASGRTPFVLGALEAAHASGAATILLTCNPLAKEISSARMSRSTFPRDLSSFPDRPD